MNMTEMTTEMTKENENDENDKDENGKEDEGNKNKVEKR